jgi:hypothetical protein
VDSDVEAVSKALAASAAERAALRRCNPPDRENRLRGQLRALSVARAPLTRELLRAPKATARFYAPDVRALAQEIAAERKRVEKMLYAKPRSASRHRKRRKRPNPNQLLGTSREAKGHLTEYYALLEDLEGVRQPGVVANLGQYYSFVDAAQEVQNEAKEARLRIAEAQRRLKLRLVYCDVNHIWQKRLDKADAEANAVKRELYACERRAQRLASAKLRRRLRRATPWTRAEAVRALDDWAAHRDWRWPTARELPKYVSLPSRTTLGSLGISLVHDRPAVSPT